MADAPPRPNTVVACLGNRVGLRVAKILASLVAEGRCEVVAYLLNGGGPGAAYDPEIVAQLPGVRPCVGPGRRLPADLAILAGYRHRVPASFVECFRGGVLNIHPGYLPFNRGSYPNVWSILDGTPAGATLHYVEADDDAGVDTGPVVARRLVPTYAWDTARELYDRCEDASLELMRQNIPRALALLNDAAAPACVRLPATPQGREADVATFHRRADVDDVDEIHMDGLYRGSDLIDLLRARTFRTFGPYDSGSRYYPGAWFRDRRTGKKVYVRVSLEVEPDDHP